MKLKWSLIGCGVAIATILVVAYLAYLFFLPYLMPALEMPTEIKTPRVVTGAGVVAKTLFSQGLRVGRVSDIVIREEGTRPGITVAGSDGAAFLDQGGQVVSTVMFAGRAGRIQIKDVNGDGRLEFVNRGEWAIDPSLIDHTGNALWTYGDGPGVNDMAAGDVEGDGVAQYAVGFNGYGGIHLLASDGTLVWKQSDGNVWHVEVVDTDGDGRSEIVHSNASGRLIIRDREGRIVRQLQPNPYVAWFSLTRWPRQADHLSVLLSAKETMWVFDFDGKLVGQFPAPLTGEQGGSARGVPVRMREGQSDCFAVLVTFHHWRNSILYIYDENGTLLYQEILGEGGSAMAAFSVKDTEREALLVGGAGRVWRYE